MKKLTNLNQLLDLYDGFIIDIWGVVHDGVAPYQGVIASINKMILLGKKILFVSNAPRPGKVIMKSLTKFGLNINEKMILSSGDLARYQLTHFSDPFFKNVNRCCYHIGSNRNQDILQDLNIKTTDNLFDAGFILLTAYMEESEDQNQYDTLLQQACELKIPLICANPDTKIVHGSGYAYCAGVLAEKYQNMGGKTHFYGKPHPSIYEMALDHFQNIELQDKTKLLCIGDTLETDIQGALNKALDSALVLTGNMESRILQNGENKSSEESLSLLFKETKLTPTWVLRSLAFDYDS